MSLAFLTSVTVSPCLCSIKNSECAFSEVFLLWTWPICGCEACCQLRSWEQQQAAVCGTTPSSAQAWGLQELWFNRSQWVLLPSLPVIPCVCQGLWDNPQDLNSCRASLKGENLLYCSLTHVGLFRYPRGCCSAGDMNSDLLSSACCFCHWALVSAVKEQTLN